MKKSLVKRLALYALLLGAMGYSATQLDFPKTKAQALCCQFGVDCPAHTLCCQPSLGQAPCSQNKPNYCNAAGC
jgi:hypothetical protein